MIVKTTTPEVVLAGSVFELTAVNETLYVAPTVTFVVPLPLKVEGELVDALSVTDPPLPELLIVQVAVIMFGGSPG